MKTFTLSALTLGLATLVVGQYPLQVITPAYLATCEVTTLEWIGGTPQYFVSIFPASPEGQPGAQPLIGFPATNGNDLKWLVDLPAGTTVMVGVDDLKDALVYSAPITIQNGNNTNCHLTTGERSLIPE